MKKPKWFIVKSVPGVTDSPEGLLLWLLPGDRFGTKTYQYFYGYAHDGSYYIERGSFSSEAARVANSVVTNKVISRSPLFASLQRWMKKVIDDGMLDTNYSVRQPAPKPRNVNRDGIAPAELKVTHPDEPVARAMGGAYMIDQFNEPWTRKSAYTIEQIVSLVNDALGTTFRIWYGWAPKGLLVVPLQHGSVMGRASPVSNGTRRLWLNRLLFTDYNADSIRRTILHELAHHKRFDEGYDFADYDPTAGHDERFCELLAMVDEVVRSEPAAKCRYFTDDIDPNLMASRTGGAVAKDIVVVFEQQSSYDKRGRRRGSPKLSLKVKPKKGKGFSPVTYPVSAAGVEAILTAYGGDALAISGASTVNGTPLDNVKTLADVIFEIVYISDQHLAGTQKIKRIADGIVFGGGFDRGLYSLDRNSSRLARSIKESIDRHGRIVSIDSAEEESHIEPGTYVVDISVGWPLLRFVFSDGTSTGWVGIQPDLIVAAVSVLGDEVRSIPVHYVRWHPGRSLPEEPFDPGIPTDLFKDALAVGERRRLASPSVISKARRSLGSVASGGFSWLSSRSPRT